MAVRIINADVMRGLEDLADDSVHCVVTSPPYWGLRDYGVDGQIGLEPTPQEFVATMVRVFREVRRVLRKDGTLWLNLGDCYASSPPGCANAGVSEKSTLHGVNGISATYRETLRQSVGQKRNTVTGGLKAKDLVGMPWRVALALQADGWWLRRDIIWHKPSCMPESVNDRCTTAHEYVFHLTKSERYFYDADAIREQHQAERRDSWRGEDADDWRATGHSDIRAGNHPNGRNKRSVWSINPQPSKEAHFALMPPELAETCIKAGCPKGGIVLDPFGGGGTTGLAADRLQRDAVLIELNPEYATLAQKRLSGDRGGLLDLMEATQ